MASGILKIFTRNMLPQSALTMPNIMHTAATRRRVHNSTIEPLPSSAYSDQDNQTLSSASNSASRSNPKPQSSATQETPTNLSPAQRRLLERIIRVDQAGELGANWIYQGQLAVLGRGDPALARLIQHMWDQEKKHLATFDRIIAQHQVRPTLLYPLWKVAGFTLGAGTALMGREAAMACTEAVETVIGEHYADQIQTLKQIPQSHPSIPLLREILVEFRDDELEHLDTAVAHDAQKASGHALLSAVVAMGCRVAIAASERV